MQLLPQHTGESLVFGACSIGTCCFGVVTLLQVVSLSNLQIIDFRYGHTGSTHDSTAWEDMQIIWKHKDIIKDEEWIWADLAYPICTCLHFFIPDSLILTMYIKISAWVVAPYKKPEYDLADNEIFNNHVSHIHIQSKHAIGFLKGQFQSLKELHIKITNQKSHKFATYCCDSLLIGGSGRTCSKDMGSEGDTLGG